MRSDNRIDIRFQKEVARRKYAERQFDKWVKWSITHRGKVLFKDIIKKQIEYNIISYDRTRH
jgi:hypothetical protein